MIAECVSLLLLLLRFLILFRCVCGLLFMILYVSALFGKVHVVFNIHFSGFQVLSPRRSRCAATLGETARKTQYESNI